MGSPMAPSGKSPKKQPTFPEAEVTSILVCCADNKVYQPATADQRAIIVGGLKEIEADWTPVEEIQ